VVSRSHRDAKLDAIKSTLGITREEASGSVGLKVGLIAEQRADVYIHPSAKFGPWDICAPEAVLRAAGGTFTDALGEPFRYEGDRTRRRGIFACNAAATAAVLPVVQRECASLAAG
jgi:3'(2'), 5'-bisphosphate nucleotidase